MDQYYQHTLSVKSHQSKQFKKDLIEHFGEFADSNNMPYTTANTTSSHCKEHQECVQNLIQGLQPISGSVNKHLKHISGFVHPSKYFEFYYIKYYIKYSD